MEYHFFTDENVGLVQTRWGHINREYNLLTRIQGERSKDKELKSEKERGTEKEGIRERSKIEKGRKEVRKRDREREGGGKKKRG